MAVGEGRGEVAVIEDDSRPRDRESSEEGRLLLGVPQDELQNVARLARPELLPPCHSHGLCEPHLREVRGEPPQLLHRPRRVEAGRKRIQEAMTFPRLVHDPHHHPAGGRVDVEDPASDGQQGGAHGALWDDFVGRGAVNGPGDCDSYIPNICMVVNR